MERVGLWTNHSKPESQALALQLTHWFRSQGWEVLCEWEEIKNQGVEFLISLGGDGTLLEAAREAAPYKIPVLGVNLGRLGFLCEIERAEVYVALRRVLNKEYSVQERLMLEALIKRTDKTELKYTVLNDVVFHRQKEDTMVTLQANLSGEPSVSYPSDGLIISTPTGSTAYALSAGGPIISPDVRAILLTPLAAHSLSARPMVVSDRELVEILLARGKECQITFDGRDNLTLRSGEMVQIKTAPLKALLIRLGRRSFPSVVREKLRDRWHE
ncbi:NAD(+)/NADH kinase [Desulfitobacterium sp.]|uniref:NAD(+)/NADH kinase n=1 Tax=Desulfitobacterium sp. TaxID=49981 RepID=UPI002B1EF42E|nr:NAD(+)/NADH kinase [Desulfitobacterium sp.]MEA4902454.1 NAD(+)/NADH kinase [Desulfitobacterium sp.]